MTVQRCLMIAASGLAVSWAQSGGSVSGRSVQSAGARFRMTFGGMQFGRPMATGAPCSGGQLNEHAQTLSDGAQKRPIERIYHDSWGATRSERPLILGPNADPVYTVVDEQGQVTIEMTQP
jgi:hypothetical protein